MLNDPNELIHGYQYVANWFLENISEKVSNKSHYNSYYRFPAFVFSLTELNDSMHLWDKYGDKHKGIRIGFTPENLINYWQILEDVTIILAPVLYHQKGQGFSGPYEKDFNEFKQNFINEINSTFFKKDLNQISAVDLSYYTSLIATLIKRKEWELEKEWRIICIPQGHVHESIIGDFYGGKANAWIENKTLDTLSLFTNEGNKNYASKDILKIGCLAGNKEHAKYIIQLLMKKVTNRNFFNDNITQSEIITI